MAVKRLACPAASLVSAALLYEARLVALPAAASALLCRRSPGAAGALLASTGIAGVVLGAGQAGVVVAVLGALMVLYHPSPSRGAPRAILLAALAAAYSLAMAYSLSHGLPAFDPMLAMADRAAVERLALVYASILAAATLYAVAAPGCSAPSPGAAAALLRREPQLPLEVVGYALGLYASLQNPEIALPFAVALAASGIARFALEAPLASPLAYSAALYVALRVTGLAEEFRVLVAG